MSTLTLRKEKHMTHGSIHHSCAKPSRQRSNYDASGLKLLATVEAEEESPKRDVNPPEEGASRRRSWRLGTMQVEKTLTPSPPSWRPGGKKSHTTKHWGLSRRSRYHSVLPEPRRKPIGVRWRDINKGDRYNVNIRSRLVAKEFNNKKCDDLFAGTPPVGSDEGR